MDRILRHVLQESSDKNHFLLESDDEYAAYFRQLQKVFERLLACYGAEDHEESFETAMVSEYLSRLLYTVQILQMKYTYTNDVEHSLFVDVTESGFPHSDEIRALRTDLTNREMHLKELPAASILKRADRKSTRLNSSH